MIRRRLGGVPWPWLNVGEQARAGAESEWEKGRSREEGKRLEMKQWWSWTEFFMWILEIRLHSTSSFHCSLPPFVASTAFLALSTPSFPVSASGCLACV